MSTTVERTLQERFDAVLVAAQAGAARSPAEARRILEARARQLARPVEQGDVLGEDATRMLLFQVGDEQFAMPVASIVAIARPGSIAPLPRAVRPVYGVTAWRGRPLTVLSLGAARPAITPDTRLLVLGSGTRAALGIVVDAVHDIRPSAAGEMTPAAPGPRHGYALGMTADGRLVVNGEALLRPETLTT